MELRVLRSHSLGRQGPALIAVYLLDAGRSVASARGEAAGSARCWLSDARLLAHPPVSATVSPIFPLVGVGGCAGGHHIAAVVGERIEPQCSSCS